MGSKIRRHPGPDDVLRPTWRLQLLHHHEHEKVKKMEALTDRLLKAAGVEPQMDGSGVHSFQGHDVVPGEIEVIAGPHRGHKMPFVGADATHFYVQRPDRDPQ